MWNFPVFILWQNINKPSAEANVAIVRPTPPAIKAELGQQQWFIALQLASEQHIILYYIITHYIRPSL